ncbi:ABC transporter substrate-binding protein [Herbaspirillum sp. NPDC101397]|uniref:ABC transporter substrate-binding protein n=1 Tax=Herbaspirillum sp. NPDC101397 TaxID=3364006 RepID=UPI00383ABDE6
MRIPFLPVRRIAALTLFFLCCHAHGQFNSPEPAGNNDIVVGQSADLSGPYAKITRQFITGANVYFAQLNSRGGIAGRRVRLMTLDDQNDPTLALKNTQELLDEHKAIALFGYIGAQTTAAVLPLINERKVPYFAPVTGSWIVYAAFNRHVFTIRASYANEYDYLFSRFTQMGLKRLAIFNDATGLPHNVMMKAKISNANAQLVASESIMGQNVDKIADKLLESRPDVVLIMSISQNVNSALIRNLRAKGYLGYFYCASLVCSPLLTSELEEAASGLIISQVVPHPWKARMPIVHEYQKAMRVARIGQFSYLGLEGYIAAKVLAEGLSRASHRLTHEKLIVALETVNDKTYDHAGYQINFSPSSHQGSTYVDVTTVDKSGVIQP